jgi:hypothetical protein
MTEGLISTSFELRTVYVCTTGLGSLVFLADTSTAWCNVSMVALNHSWERCDLVIACLRCDLFLTDADAEAVQFKQDMFSQEAGPASSLDL